MALSAKTLGVLGVVCGLAIAVAVSFMPSCAGKTTSPLTGQQVSLEQAREDQAKKEQLEAKALEAARVEAQAKAAALQREREEAARLAQQEQERVLAAARRELTRETAKVEAARTAAIAELQDAFAAKADASAAQIEQALRTITTTYDGQVRELQDAYATLERDAQERAAAWESAISAAEDEEAKRWALLTTLRDVGTAAATVVVGPTGGQAVSGISDVLLTLFGVTAAGYAVKKRAEAGKASRLAEQAQARKEELNVTVEKIVDSIDDAKQLMDPATWDRVKTAMRERQGDTVTAIVQSVRNHVRASDAAAKDAAGKDAA